MAGAGWYQLPHIGPPARAESETHLDGNQVENPSRSFFWPSDQQDGLHTKTVNRFDQRLSHSDYSRAFLGKFTGIIMSMSRRAGHALPDWTTRSMLLRRLQNPSCSLVDSSEGRSYGAVVPHHN